MIPKYTLTIYGIFDKEEPHVYIGKTNRELKQRFRNHHFFDKRYYPNTKSKDSYDIRVIKEIIIFPQCKFRDEDYEGFFINKYREDNYKILNKKNVPFTDPFNPENMFPKLKTRPKEHVPHYGPHHIVKRNSWNWCFENFKETKQQLLEYFQNHKDWLNIYLQYRYDNNPPQNWFEILLTNPSIHYIPNKILDGQNLKWDNKIKL